MLPWKSGKGKVEICSDFCSSIELLSPGGSCWVLTTCNTYLGDNLSVTLDTQEHTKQPSQLSLHGCSMPSAWVSAGGFSPVPTGGWGQFWTPGHLARVLTLPRLGSYPLKTEQFDMLSFILIAIMAYLSSAAWCYEFCWRTASVLRLKARFKPEVAAAFGHWLTLDY